ncbi:MFS transporter [Sorangium sp. So ce726]|uniref:MFS transporter n=1 Tax=Sorangium sp. So ce726 TaxID=3133319 RepID=UPI003F63E7C6
MTKMTRYQWLLIALLSANFGVVFFDRNAMSYLASFIQQDLGLTNTQIGDIAAALSFAWAIAGVLMGMLVDRFGRRKLMLVITTLVFSLASVLSGFASGFVALLGARLLMGVAEGGIIPITQTLIASDVPHERRGLAQGLAQNLGTNLLANFLGPLVIVWMGTRYGWRNAFFLSAIPGVITAALIAWLVREPAIEAVRARPEPGAVGRMLRDRNIVLCILISTLLVAFLLVFFTFTPLYLLNVRGFRPHQMSVIMSSFGIASMAVAFLVPGSSDHFGRKPVIIIASLIGLGMPLGMLFVAGMSRSATMACIALGASLSGVFPMVMATIPSEVAGPAGTTTAMSLTMGISEIVGGVFAPGIAGRLADAQGLEATLWILTGITLAIIVLAQLLRETAPAALARCKPAA